MFARQPSESPPGSIGLTSVEPPQPRSSPVAFSQISLRYIKLMAMYIFDGALTEPPLLDFLCGQCKHGKHFDHKFDDDVRHHRCGWDCHIYLKTLEEVPQAFKQFKKSVVTRGDPTGSLT